MTCFGCTIQLTPSGHKLFRGGVPSKHCTVYNCCFISFSSRECKSAPRHANLFSELLERVTAKLRTAVLHHTLRARTDQHAPSAATRQHSRPHALACLAFAIPPWSSNRTLILERRFRKRHPRARRTHRLSFPQHYCSIFNHNIR